MRKHKPATPFAMSYLATEPPGHLLHSRIPLEETTHTDPGILGEVL